MKKYYYEEGSIALLGIDKEDFVKNMYNWSNDDKVTYYMVTGLKPGNVEKLEEEYDNLVKRDNIVFAIVDKKSKKTIGFAGLYAINWIARHAEFRIIMGNTMVQGKGIGTIVTKYTVKYAFENLNLDKIWLGVNTENKGAIKCYEKSGFVHEGILRQEMFRNNRYYDMLRMSILRKGYEKKR